MLKSKMKKSLILLLSISLLLLSFVNIFPQPVSAATITAANNTPAAVQTAINSAVDGDTVIIPNGNVAWSSGVTISGKGIHLKGQTKGSMVITFNCSGSAISVTEDTTHRVQISDLKFVNGSNQTDHSIIVYATSGGKAVLIHDNEWYGPRLNAIRMQTKRGVIYNNSINSTGLSAGTGGDVSFVQNKCEGAAEVASWYTASTMGTADTTGENNLYIEDNYIKNAVHQSIDFDDNSRVVIRYNTFDNSAMSSHGPDTSNYGTRHFEIYNNDFIFTAVAGDYTGSQTANLDNFLFLRGGTGVITDNDIDDINSSAWGNKSEFKFTVMMPWRAAGPFGGWDWTLPNVTVNSVSHSIAGYPVPRQVGTTWTGSGSSETSAIAFDPVYIWNNTGTGNMTPAFDQYANECGASGASQTISQYLQMGRDVKAQARPGYTKYTYPHPLRSGGGPTATPGPTSTPTPTPTPAPVATSTPTPTPPSGGRTFYVDQTAGNDSNSGTSASPWKNCPGMTAWSGSASLAAGDTVYFDKGDTWLCTGTYGLNVTGGVTYIGDSWGASGTRATIRANADLASVVEFRADNPTYATVVKGFNVDGNSRYTSGVGFNYPYYAPTPLNGAVKRVENCDVHHTNSNTSLGQYAYGIIVSNHGDNNSRVENVEILNNTVHDNSRDSLCLYPGDENANCIVKNVTVRGNTVYNSGQDPNYGAGSNICIKGRVIDSTIEYNYLYNSNASGIFMNSNETNHFGYGIENLTVRYNVVGAGHRYGSIRIYDGSSGGDPKDIKIYGNILSPNTGAYGLYIDQDLKGTNTLRVYNNTSFNAPTYVNAPNATFSLFEFKNNIVYDTDGRTPITGTSYFTASSNNQTTNPSFKNTSNLPTGFTGTYGSTLAPNNDGLSLLSGSTAINAGTVLVSPYNGSINTVTRPSGSAFDIGAYEYNGGSPTPTPGPTATPTPTPANTPTPTPTPANTPTPTPTPVPGGWTRVEETGTGVSFNGVGWANENNGNHSGGSLKWTGNGHEYAFFTFTGTGVRWYDKRDTNRGKTDVFIDNVLQTTVDGYGSSSFQYKMYEKTGLSNGSHTLKLDTTGTKNPSSSGTRVGVDCFEYTGGTGGTTPTPTPTPTPAPTPTPTPTPTPAGGWTRIQENGTGVTYDGAGWTTYSDSNCSGGALKRTGNGHEYAFFTFTGTGVRWYDKRDTNRGKTDVYIDNVKQATIDGYGSAQYIYKMYEKTGLSSGTHTLKLDTTGTKNPSSSGTQVGVDCFEYTN